MSRISARIGLAAASGYCCCLVFENASESVLTRALMGLLFAGGVVFPYLRRERLLVFRAIGLVAISSVSFELATSYGLRVGAESFGIAPGGYMAASLLGAAVALTGARFLVPLQKPLKLLATGFTAAIIGGLGFVLAGDRRLCLAFVLWHSLMTIAIFGAEHWPFSVSRAK